MSGPVETQSRDELTSNGSSADSNAATTGKSRVALLTVALFALYLLSASYSNPYGTDAFTNAAQARAFADDQDPILEELDGMEAGELQGVVAWFTESPEGTTSQYPPGTALWAAPFYLADSSYEIVTLYHDGGTNGQKRIPIDIAVPSTYVPAAIAAALSVSIAIGLLGLTLAPQMSERSCLAAMAVSGLGTGAWSVAADEIWQHGPAMMCISAGNYFASRDRFVLSGLTFGAAILVRPHTAVIAACVGLAIGIRRRSIREVLVMGCTSALGLAALLGYNKAVFGSYSISGGYSGVFTDRFANSSLLLLAERLVQSLVHVRVGMLWTSPFLGFAFVAAMRRRKSAPDWAVGAAIGGVLYLIIQYRANRVTGGAGFFGYRYPLEALMAAGPMLAFALTDWLKGGERRRVWFAFFSILSIIAHGAGAMLL